MHSFHMLMPYFYVFIMLVLVTQAHAGEITANQLHRNTLGLIQAEGDVRLSSQSFDAYASRLLLDSDAQTIELFQGKVHFKPSGILKGSYLQRIDLNRFQGEMVEYSTCPEDEQAWRIRASSAVLDHELGVFTAEDAWLEIAGIPILYTPHWQHALSRRSGFLMPRFAESSRRGLTINLPFYWAASPNWDMTLGPHWMEKRGTMAEIEWRHRFAAGHESIQVQSLFDEFTQENRYRVRGDMDWQLASAWDANIHVDTLSDGLFVADFPLPDETTIAAYVTSKANLGWHDDSDSALLSAVYQQRLGSVDNASTLQILPRLQTRHIFHLDDNTLDIQQQSTWFRRDKGVSGQRLALRPTWQQPWQFWHGAVAASWTTTGQYVDYVSNQFRSQRSSYSAIASSMEVSANIERISEDKQWRHLITPTIKLDVSAAPDQQHQPLYDSSLAPLSISNILRGNRYSGWDRFERMRRVALLLNSSLQHKEGKQNSSVVLQAQLGLVWDDLRQSVDEKRVSNPTRDISNTLAELVWLPSSAWRSSMGGQYDSELDTWVESHASVRWSGNTQQYAQLTWQRTAPSHSAEAESLHLSAKMNINGRWSTHMLGQYDVVREQVLQAVGGVTYQHPCWQLMLETFQSPSLDEASENDVGIRFLLEFDGLGSFGDS